MEEASGVNMARNIGTMVAGFAGVLAEQRPDVVLLLGDRGEMLAGALAAIHLNIPVVHIHGGERSGTIDEPVRHAISKLSHFHFTATADARARLIRMGESASNVYVIGAPGIDGIVELAQESRGALCAIFGFDPARPLALFVYHPVVQESDCDGKEVAEILDLLISRGIQVVALRPNSDAGSDAIRTRLESRASHALVHLLTHMGRARFAAMMAEADVMIGNSSAGIIEAASFGIPVVNIGSRQNLRERNKNVRDVDLNLQAIGDAIDRAMQAGRYPRTNIYGDGQAARRIVALLQNIPLDNTVLMKTNAY
ncbi:GDP/UDP-N,N'-diacetylbacillosamine 2-epimerase (hydrolysing) [Herbaspirillum sp. SJZ099]|nr:GDP/UDP-N,N'-diacetylbacillosamine 2-epimerase (hydrolysing) [Herbaspirillum sp. SJZ099]